MTAVEEQVLTFRVSEPQRAALHTIRRALVRYGLRAAAELDIRARISQELGAVVAPCVVLYVDDPASLLEAAVFDRGAALLIPLPIVVTSQNGATDVLVRNAEWLKAATPEALRDPLDSIHSRLLRALESISERADSLPSANRENYR
jgi:uncharacterized protein (DUF302 family)